MYKIEEKSGRFIVWRLTEDNMFRQGSFETKEEANLQVEASRCLTTTFL